MQEAKAPSSFVPVKLLKMKTQIQNFSFNKISLVIAGILICINIGAQAQNQNIPLEILKTNGKVCMKWEIAEKIIPKMFLVEKSTDGIKFETIGMRETTNERVYSFCDEESIDKISMYRIMKVESKNKVWIDNMNEVSITQYTNTENVRLSYNDKSAETGKAEPMFSKK